MVVSKTIPFGSPKLRSLIVPMILIVVVGFSSAGLVYVLWQSQKPIGQTELERQVVEFLKTTEVKNVWDGTVEIAESYDHKTGGKAAIVQYTTTSGGHPHFMLEFIENHRAVITLNESGKVTFSAFCVHGSLQDGKIWDLINQRWISGNV